jgi:hypothetical protein
MYVQPIVAFPGPARNDAHTVGTHVFRDALLWALPNIQTAEIDSNCERKAIFQTLRESFHGTPCHIEVCERLDVGVGTTMPSYSSRTVDG